MLKGFTLECESGSYTYYGDEDALRHLKRELAKHLFQQRIQDEYEAAGVIGQGNYAMVCG